MQYAAQVGGEPRNRENALVFRQRTRVPSHESRVTSHGGAITPYAVGAVLLAVYWRTLAPDITLWDAGEFHAAVASLGIPHPPGTPLYIVIGNVWTRVTGLLPSAPALNLLSAVATAAACGLLGGLVARWTRQRLAGIAAGVSAGGMLSVWRNATEAEVYAVSLLLGVLMLVAGDRAGTTGSVRHRLLLAYLMGLAVPIQISALVVAPAAILLAASPPEGGPLRRRVVLALGSVLLVVVALSQGSIALGAVGLGTGLLAGGWPGSDRRRLEPAALGLVMVLGASATLFMRARAPHDPFVNQGNPSTIGAMMDVVTLQQYPMPGLWPRRAPPWIQLVNVVQYADWQVASGLDPSVAASPWRTPFSVAALALLLAGAAWHRRHDPRGAAGMALLVLGGTLGVAAVLNLNAGPSILDSVLPAGARHEPRERDYFFAWGFAGAGAWVGLGAVVLARRWCSPRAPSLVGPVALGLAALPIALNWREADRRPEAMLATTLGEALLATAPPNAVLLLAGDNDSYTTWYRQAALAERRDVVPVTIPLLPAAWYREELARRHGLLDSSTVAAWKGDEATVRALAQGARARGRPFAAAVTVSSALRQQVAPAWTLGGLAYVADHEAPPQGDRVDRAAVEAIARLIAARIPGPVREHDPARAYVASVLRCPEAARQLAERGSASAPLLDSRCNFK